MQIVSNTSPLSNLALIGEISVLQQIYSKILIPPSVETELMQFPKIRPTISNLIDAEWLVVKPPQELQMVAALEQTLDPGEAAAIALAVELQADRLLIDERIGRLVAAQYGLKLRGIVGILVSAKNQGLIPAIQPILDQLINDAGFWVSRALYELALRESGEL